MLRLDLLFGGNAADFVKPIDQTGVIHAAQALEQVIVDGDIEFAS